MTQKKQKYNAKKVECDGFLFDSTMECKYYEELKEKVKNGEIKSFAIQPVYVLQPKFEKLGKKYRAITYAPDFMIEHKDGRVELIDIKGFSTQQGELRKKLFDYGYPEIELKWITYVKKHGGWIETDDLKKIRKENKKSLNK